MSNYRNNVSVRKNIVDRLLCEIEEKKMDKMFVGFYTRNMHILSNSILQHCCKCLWCGWEPKCNKYAFGQSAINMSYHRPHIMSIDSDAIIMHFGKYPSLYTSAYASNMGESQNAKVCLGSACNKYEYPRSHKISINSDTIIMHFGEYRN